jgi:hypothetical protein
MAEIAKLRAENKQLLDWILGNTDALTCLQGIYNNPASSEFSKIKGATAALPLPCSATVDGHRGLTLRVALLSHPGGPFRADHRVV